MPIDRPVVPGVGGTASGAASRRRSSLRSRGRRRTRFLPGPGTGQRILGGVTTPGDRITSFSLRRQRLDGTAGSALEAVAAVVGVYSSMPSGPLSIRARAPRAAADDVRALEQERLAVRMRAMRTSAFLVPRATAALVAAATAVPDARFGWMLRAAGIREGELAGIRATVLDVAAEPGTPAELRSRLESRGVGGAEAPWTAGAALGRVLSVLTALGDLVAVGGESLSSNSLRYVGRQAWFDGAMPEATTSRGAPSSAGRESAAAGPDATPAEGRAWLAREYLRAFGPARLEDLAWWAAMSRAQAGSAIAAHDTIDVGDGLLLLTSDIPAFEAAPPLSDTITLLPKWDAWTMGYPLGGRSRFLDHDVHDRVFDGDGNGLAMVLRAGRAIGAWTHRGARGTMQVDLDIFEREPAAIHAAIETELAAIAAFLGYRGFTVRSVPTVVPARRRQRRPLEPDLPSG